MGELESEIGKDLIVTDPNRMHLSQQVQSMAEIGGRFGGRFGAAKAAPSSAGERVWEVTKEGLSKIPEGFENSLNPERILPNLGISAAVGAAVKLALPEAGPVGRLAGTVLAVSLIGEPIVHSYSMAVSAKTMNQMHLASDTLGNTLGGMPLLMIESSLGAKLGAGLMGKALATEVATPLVNWKANRYGNLML